MCVSHDRSPGYSGGRVACHTTDERAQMCYSTRPADNTGENATMHPDKGGALCHGFSSATVVTIVAATRGGYMIDSASTLAAITSSWTSIPSRPASILSKLSKRRLGPVMSYWP